MKAQIFPSIMKKRSEETQILRAGGVKFFRPTTDPFPGAWDGQNLFNWRWSLPLPVWWGSMHAISSYRGNRPTNTCCPPIANTQTGLITIHCAAKLSMQCNEGLFCCSRTILARCHSWSLLILNTTQNVPCSRCQNFVVFNVPINTL